MQIKNKTENEDGTQGPLFVAECESERTLFERTYFNIAATAHQIIRRHEQQAIREREVAAGAAPRRTDVKLPVLKIPEFDGSYEK